MSGTTTDPTAVTDERHDTSWSANLELPEHADDPATVIEGAKQAIHHTAAGTHVNLVTHGDHDHPKTYLYDELESAFGDAIAVEYVEQCGCGGHVSRVQVLAE